MGNHKLDWKLIFEIIVVVFLGGIAYNSFETKLHASETYVTKELSNERWSNNKADHEKIDVKLDDILRELRRKK